jgi:hypothetical protein
MADKQNLCEFPEHVDSPQTDEKMECDEFLEIVEDSAKATGLQDKSLISPMTSDTSGVEMKLDTSSGTEAGVSASIAPSDASGTESGATASISPSDASSGAAAVPLASLAPSDTSSGVEAGSSALVSPSVTPSIAEEGPSTSMTLLSTSKAISPQQKGLRAKIGALKNYISPPKDKSHDEESPKEKSKSRSKSLIRNPFRSSKSMSPPDKSMAASAAEEPSEPAGEQASGGVLSDQDVSPSASSPPKKGRQSIKKRLKKSLSSIGEYFTSKKGTQVPESEVLAADAEAPGTLDGATDMNVEEQPTTEGLEVGPVKKRFAPFWDSKYSPDPPSDPLCPTLLTDIPSVNSGSDVFEDEPVKTSIDTTRQEVPSGSEACTSRQQTSETPSNVVARTPTKRPAEVLSSQAEGGAEDTSTPFKRPNLPVRESPDGKEEEPKKKEDESESKMQEL